MDGPPASPGGRGADLHVHTHFSDGSLSPEEVVARAIGRGLRTLAVTDHDTVEGIAPARRAAGDAIELVPGVEMSATHEGLEVHVLGYFLDTEDPTLLGRLADFRAERHARALAMIERLRGSGASIDAQEVLAGAGPGVIGRPHLAAALLRAGHVGSVDEAFKRYLGPHGRAFVPRPAFAAGEAVALIRSASGVSVLAHPGGGIAETTIDALLEAGLQGLEVQHPHHSPAVVRRLRTLARARGMLETGGSDFHGVDRSADVGDVQAPNGAVDALRRAARPAR